jgi:hypothetical protein
MLQILEKCPKLNHNEDGFFSGGCEDILPKKPTPDEAREFSIETRNSKQSFGIHKAWEHLPNDINVIASVPLGQTNVQWTPPVYSLTNKYCKIWVSAKGGSNVKEDFNISFPTIGEKLGGRDHTTVIHSCEKIKRDIKVDNTLFQQINQIRSML